MADLRTRAAMNRHFRRGTWLGEIGRSGLLFKTFGISILLTHGRRMLEQSTPGSIAYAASLFALTTLGGAAALELKELAKGKDHRPIGKDHLSQAKFVGAAAAQGGGWGIFGDFLYSGTNRFGGGIAGTLAGPQAQTAQNVLNLGVSSVNRALGDKKARPGRDVVTLLKQETPGSSLWFWRVAFEREIADRLQAEIDPNYRQSWRSTARRAKQQGQQFWWEPGETSPQRAPK
jgi:hypothetical protein